MQRVAHFESGAASIHLCPDWVIMVRSTRSPYAYLSDSLSCLHRVSLLGLFNGGFFYRMAYEVLHWISCRVLIGLVDVPLGIRGCWYHLYESHKKHRRPCLTTAVVILILYWAIRRYSINLPYCLHKLVQVPLQVLTLTSCHDTTAKCCLQGLRCTHAFAWF